MQEYKLENPNNNNEIRIFVLRQNGQWFVHFDSGLKLGEFDKLHQVEGVLRAAKRHYEKTLGKAVNVIRYLDMCSGESFPEE